MGGNVCGVRAVGKLALGLQSLQLLASFQMLLFWLVVSD